LHDAHDRKQRKQLISHLTSIIEQ